jgi:serine/threonine protein kinase
LSFSIQLKSGSFATVCRGTHRATGKKVAIKCVLRKDLPPADDAAIYDEVAILASLEHPYIVPLIDFFEEKDCYFLVMELMAGGDLFDRIGKKKSYSEADARDLVCKMLKAMSYCHSNKIAHCDMKPKNLLLMSDENDSFIKLADFGFAARVYDPKSLSKQCGTPFFVSPEILLRHPYDHQSDMWSVGCIVYLLLSGNLPFMGRSQKDLFRKIVSGKYEFDEDWTDVSDDAKDLVSKLLVLDPDVRWTADKALRHPWLRASQDRLSMILLQRTSQRLKTFNARMKLRSAMIAVDWISSLTRMSWSSKMAAAVAAGGGGAAPVNPLLAAARKAAAQQAAAENPDGAAAEAPSPPPVDKFAALTLEEEDDVGVKTNQIKEEDEEEEEDGEHEEEEDGEQQQGANE